MGASEGEHRLAACGVGLLIGEAYLSPLDGEYDLTSSVNLRSGLLAVGALRPEEGAPQDPVALETTVIATGARPGDTGTNELFTEETQTVLVFENGAVIRFSAAVADGQLLFLKNKATAKKWSRKCCARSFRPTNCYIDLNSPNRAQVSGESISQVRKAGQGIHSEQRHRGAFKR